MDITPPYKNVPYKNTLSINNSCQQAGFTLVELVMVMVILSILAVGSVKFISFSAQGYVDTVRRSELSSTATIVNEKISRLVRDALPNSVRISADTRCLEFIPVLAASQYTQTPIAGSPLTIPRTTVTMVPIDARLSQSGFLAIYPMPNQHASLYSGADNPGFISTETATTTVLNPDVFTFSSALSFQFFQHSPKKRIFITGSPVAFCQLGTRLYFYRNYGFEPVMADMITALPTTVPNRLLIADKLAANTLAFTYLPSSLRRNAIVAFQLDLLDSSNGAETLVINQEVQIRNVP
jgi:MSHA biogenesis protein MshO